MHTIPLVYDEKMMGLRHSIYIHWDIEANPHLAVSGVTGTGKTFLCKLILARIGLYFPTTRLTICDFKGDDSLRFLTECYESRYHIFESCKDGFDLFYNGFIKRQSGEDKSRSLNLLWFDEWSSFLNYLDKKQADDYRKKLSTLLMLGRSFNYHILLSQQRLSADEFSKSRDNLNIVITLGNPSKEVIGMLFSDYKDLIENDRGRGTGYMMTNGTNFRKIVVPQVTDFHKLENYIKRAVQYRA